ncbi:MAG: Cof-type HAD-IIB family hydrolase [Lachnospiraceae bacterium]|nr:Cof-type HAD-IIB family hydrolase [Lachnospiraceae bacterium]
MIYKLLALDMDGTVLAPDTTMTAVTREAITQALDAGVTVVFCSGRCKDEIREFVEIFPKMRYVVCENGVCVWDIETDSYVDFRGLERSVSDRILATAEGYDVLIQLGIDGKYYLQDGYLERLDEFGLGKYYGLLSETGGIASDLMQFYHDYDGLVSKINFYCNKKSDRAEIFAKLEKEDLPIYLLSGLADNIEMNSTSAGKDVGLQALCEHLGITAEQVIAIGDNLNDISMLKFAGFSIAMGNARPEVKAICKAETLDNGRDGVAAAIHKYILH